MVGIHFKAQGRTFPWEVVSINEEKIEKNLKKLGRDFMISYASKSFVRIYPKGTRFDSSNYSPIPGWRVGAQLVATNFQTKDTH